MIIHVLTALFGSVPSPYVKPTKSNMADAAPRKRTFKKFQFRGMDLETMVELSNEVRF
jgi:hypothetical protein